QQSLKPSYLHSVAAHTVRAFAIAMGQRQLAAIQGLEPKPFPYPFLSNFFREEPGWLIACQAFGQLTDQRGLSHTRQSGEKDMAHCICQLPSPMASGAFKERSQHNGIPSCSSSPFARSAKRSACLVSPGI